MAKRDKTKQDTPERDRKGRRRGVLRTMAAGMAIVVALFVVNARHPVLLRMAELKAFDLRMYARGPIKPRGEVVIAAIDDASITSLGRWPWPRSVLADLVSALKDYQVAVVGFDLVASEPDAEDIQRKTIRDKLETAGLKDQQIAAVLGPDNDGAFAQALKDQGAAFLGFPFQDLYLGSDPHRVSAGFQTKVAGPAPFAYGLVREPPGPPPPVLTAGAYLPNLPNIAGAARGTVYFNVDADLDGTIRSESMVVRFGSRYCAPLVLAVVSAYAKGALLSLTLADFGVADVSVGGLSLPTDEIGRMLVNFRGPAHTFPYYSVVDIVNHRTPPAALRGKIVLVGATARGVGDRWGTPMGADYPGVEVHANAIDNILSGDFIQRSSVTASLESVAAALMGLGVSLAVALLSAPWSAAAVLGLGVGYFLFAQHLLVAQGVLIGILFPLLTLVVTYTALASYRYLTEGREKRHLRHAFEHYLHPEVIASLVADPGALKLGGERRHLSIMFTDIVGFTTRAERTPPEELVALLNVYMTAMTDLVMKHAGVVDKLMGDGLMAFWGAPATLPNPARNAIDCGLEMLATLKRMRESDQRFADFEIGIGIATGDAIVGNFGGDRRFDYSVIGDTANLGSRLEGLTRHFKVPLIVNQETFVEAAGPYLARELGMVRVKGKKQPVTAFEVAGRADDGLNPEFYAQFAQALDAIRRGAGAQALEQLQRLAEQKPDDRVLELYLARLRASAEAARFGWRHILRRRANHAPADGAEVPAEMLFEFDTK